MSFTRSLIAIVLLLLALPLSAQEHNVRPPQGLVPDSKTAIAIAVAVWTPIYSEKQIASQKPYRATLTGGKWTVTGSPPQRLVRRHCNCHHFQIGRPSLAR